MPTIREYNLEQFYKKLAEYRKALETGEDIVNASLAIYISKNSVPKRYHGLVNRTYRETMRIK